MLLTIGAWNNKKKEFFFTEGQLEGYFSKQSHAVDRYIVANKHMLDPKYQFDKKHELDKKLLPQLTVQMMDRYIKHRPQIANSIFRVVEANLLKKLDIKQPTNLLICSARLTKYSKYAFFHVESFSQLMKCILKKKSLTAHLKPTEHYVVYLVNRRNNREEEKNIDELRSFQMPNKYDSSVSYYLGNDVIGDFVKIDNQESYNKLFAKHDKMVPVGWSVMKNNYMFIKGNCFNSEKSVLEIDKIMFVMEYIDDEITGYIENLPVSDVVKKYLFVLCKNEYYHMCGRFLAIYIDKNASMAKYKSLSGIKYKS